MDIKNKKLRYKLGILCVVLSFISPLFSLLVPFFDLSTETAVTVGTIFLIGLPEVFFILGAILAGKKVVRLLTQKIKAWFFRKKNKK
ncbi:MAG: transporter suffix domain-containing protein [Legionella sp.]|nr:transporter suffix domain-containing protein [Legionella sp.]